MKKAHIIIPYFGLMLGIILFMLSVKGNATQYTPETGMNNRYGNLVANYKKSTLDDTIQADSDQLDRIRDRVCSLFFSECLSNSSAYADAVAAEQPTDGLTISDITRAERSKFFIQKTKIVWRGWLQDAAEREYITTHSGGIDAAKSDAAADAN